MNLHGLSQLLIKDTPLLATAVSTVSPAAGIVINLIVKLFNADPNNLDDISTKMAADPNAAIKLKQLELEHADILSNNELQDRENARQREIEIDKITGKRDIILDVISLIVIIGYFLMCGVICATRLDQSDHDVLYMMVGQLTGGFIMVLSYYFGSSNKTV